MKKLTDRLKPHLNAPTAIAFIALCFAISGISYAATGGGKGNKNINSFTARAAKKGARGPRGPQGPPGKNGTNGLNGAPGAQGPAGPAGEKGPAGQKGAAGAAGAKGKEGPEGLAGAAGAEGSPWTDGGTLPEKTSTGAPATETGAWKVDVPPGLVTKPTSYGRAIVSFPIPLTSEAAGKIKAHYITLEEQDKENGKTAPAECVGTAAAPTAVAGTLCVYEAYAGELGGKGFELEATEAPKFNGFYPPIPPDGETGVGTTGTLIAFSFAEHITEGVRVGAESDGTWAVTAP
jgi:hypothetical protein